MDFRRILLQRNVPEASTIGSRVNLPIREVIKRVVTFVTISRCVSKRTRSHRLGMRAWEREQDDKQRNRTVLERSKFSLPAK